MASTIKTIRRGDTYRWSVAITQNGDPVDISGWILSCTIKPEIDDDETDAAAYLAVDHTFPTDGDSAVGVGDFELQDIHTKDLPLGPGVIDLQLFVPGSPSTTITVLAPTEIEITGDVTRRAVS